MKMDEPFLSKFFYEISVNLTRIAHGTSYIIGMYYRTDFLGPAPRLQYSVYGFESRSKSLLDV